MRGLSLSIVTIALLASPAIGQQTGQEFGKGAYRADTPGLVKPKLLKQVPPNYPNVAKNASVAGDVEIEAVVGPDGKVGDLRIVKSLDTRFGLDQEAVRVAKLWIFEPARKDGFPVPVIVTIVVSFKLTSSNRPTQPLGTPSGTFTASTVPALPLIESDEDFAGGASRSNDPGVVPPVVKKQVPAVYPSTAKGRRISNARVELDAIVMPDGTVGKVRVAKSLDKTSGVSGFDAAAIAAVKQWIFEPGTKDGVAVPVLMKLIVSF
jgi:TonB family protein